MTDGENTIGSEEPATNNERQEILSPYVDNIDRSLDNSGRQSRRLYVITEESHSNIGPAISMEDY